MRNGVFVALNHYSLPVLSNENLNFYGVFFNTHISKMIEKSRSFNVN
jgi:hypothetical protein